MAEANQLVNLSVKEKDADIITFAQIVNGFAAIGTIDKFNCGGSIEKMTLKKISVILT